MYFFAKSPVPANLKKGSSEISMGESHRISLQQFSLLVSFKSKTNFTGLKV